MGKKKETVVVIIKGQKRTVAIADIQKGTKTISQDGSLVTYPIFLTKEGEEIERVVAGEKEN